LPTASLSSSSGLYDPPRQGSPPGLPCLLPIRDLHPSLDSTPDALAGVERVTDSKGRVTPITAFDGAGTQWERSRSIPFEEGARLPGALLFIQSESTYRTKPHYIGHVAISLGNGYVLEARGPAYGVTIGPVRPSFNLAAKISELYTPAVLG